MKIKNDLKTIVSLKPKKRIEIKKFIKIAVWVIIAINVFQFVRPFFVTIEKIENDVLKIIPIGTSWDEAVEIIESKKKWYVPTAIGLVHFSSLSEHDIRISSIIEKKRIPLSLRNYGHPLFYTFFAFNVTLVFDEELKLTSVEGTQYLSI